MNARFGLKRLLAVLVCGAATQAGAVEYFINDDYTPGVDIYTTASGNNAFAGTSSNQPKRTLGNLIASTNLLPGDVIKIDSGSHTNVTIPASVSGTSGNPIVFQGSPSSTFFTVTSGNGVTINGSWLRLRDFRISGGQYGLFLNSASYSEFENIVVVSNANSSIRLEGNSNSNAFRHCVGSSTTTEGFSMLSPAKGNYLENCVAYSLQGWGIAPAAGALTNVQDSVIIGRSAFGNASWVPDAGRNLVVFCPMSFHRPTTVEFTRQYTNFSKVMFADPGFLNLAGFDFHELSPAGMVSNGVWVTNSALPYSPLVDFGSPGDPALANEPSTNGGRVNIGLYGGTAEASKGRTNAWLFALSFNDGGNLIQTGQLEWVGGNLGSNATVDLQFSTNSGATWSNLVTGVAATNETHTWAPATALPSVLWRVVHTNSGVSSTNARVFSIRPATNTVFNFYVNDATNDANDVYCSAAGNSANTGVSSNSPKRHLQEVLDNYDLEPGDAVYVDTGYYLTNVVTTFSWPDGGSPLAPVRIVGSTNGTVLSRGSPASDTLLFRADTYGGLQAPSFLSIENLQLTGGSDGVEINSSSNVVFRNVWFTGNLTGVRLEGAANQVRFEGCLAANNEAYGLTAAIGPRSNLWQTGVMWNNPTSLVVAVSNLWVSNSILGGSTVAFGSQVPLGDHNLLWNTGVGGGFSTLTALQNAGQWTRSLYDDPLFLNAAGGDFHLLSPAGMVSNGVWVTNTALPFSPAIDLGDPVSMAHTNEPTPNGSRVNVGMFGGTAQASKSRTNLWLQTLSYMDGGQLDARVGSWLRWTGSAFASTNRVTLWLSRDSGASWEVLVTNIVATNGQYFYQNLSTNDPSSLVARWRVTLEGVLPEVSGESRTNFLYRNGNFNYYVNDESRSNDVWCSNVGNNTNLGTSAGSPMLSLDALLARYSMSPGDRIYIDTGIYTNTFTVSFFTQHSGVATNPVQVIGSPDCQGGSLFGRAGIGAAFVFQPGSSNIVLRDVKVQIVDRGVAFTNAANIVLDGVEVRNAGWRGFDLQNNARNIELRRCVAHGGAIGAYLQQVTNIVIRNSVFWTNGTHAIAAASQVGLLVENTILASTNAGAILYSVAETNGFISDYNGIHAGPYVRVGVRGTNTADNLAAWQALSGGQDLRSIPGDPQMANPAGFDYHLKTEQTQGRTLPCGGKTADTVSSPLLDAGNPASPVGDEPAPNGKRINIGRFGGTAQASSAQNNSPWLRTVSFGDAGDLANGTTALRWTAGGSFSNETVEVKVSVDGGKTWDTTVATGVPATNEVVNWNVTGLPDTPAALWRMTCLERTNVVAQSPVFFAIRNSPLNLYIATADTNDTVYISGPGRPDNWTATAAAPLNSLAKAFDLFDLTAGDTLWVDNGIYNEEQAILVGLKDSGTSNNPVRVVGNTNKPYAGTILSRPVRIQNANGFYLYQASGIQLESLMVSNAWIGLLAEHSQAITLERARLGYCVTNAMVTNANLLASRTLIDNGLFAGINVTPGGNLRLYNSLFREIGRHALLLQGGDTEIRNSILQASGSQKFIFWRLPGVKLVSDYNAIRVADGASVGGGYYTNGLVDRFLIDWQISNAFSNDVRSFGYDPLFANEGGLDFHLQSQYGRYVPGPVPLWTNDPVTSRLIDLGDPAFAFANEPTNNGGRINVDLHGNTPEASRSSGTGALVPLTMSDGGTIRGVAKLYWSFNGISSGEYVNVDFSWDAGVSWTNIAVLETADRGLTGLTWATTNFPSTAQGVWRVCTTNGAICGQTEIPFAVKNVPLAYYVNDASTNGDVYCVGPGSAGNSGVTSNSPLDSLERLFNRYKVEHGDTVYVDTGLYPRSSPLEFSYPDPAATNFLVIQGSTNAASAGTVFTNSNLSSLPRQPVIDLLNSRLIELRDLNLHGGEAGVVFGAASENRLLRVRSVWSRGVGFELGIGADLNQFIRCAALNFSRTGLHVVMPTLATIPGTTNYWSQGVLASVPPDSNGVAVATGALIGVRSGRLYVSNSVLVAASPAHMVFTAIQGAIHGDYNCYHRPQPGSWMVEVPAPAITFGIQRSGVVSLDDWRGWNGSDANSIAADPLFADLTGGNLRPLSAGGRFDPVLNDFVSDPVTSPLIDAADPALPWSLEQGNNGRRANLGVYGNTDQASQTPTTNGTYVLMSFNQGGIASGVQTLRWLARGAATNPGQNVIVSISTNSGTNWRSFPLGTNLGSSGSAVWDTTTFPSVPTARWRVQSQSQAEWITISEADFVIRNTNVVYYVNDGSSTNDLFCDNVGSSTNTGLASNSPLLSLQAVLARYDVEPGDVIYIDTGIYSAGMPTVVGFMDSGTATNPVVIAGSTNHPGVQFTGAGLYFENARGVVLRNIRLNSQTWPANAVEVLWSENIVAEQVDVLDSRGNGFAVSGCSNVTLRNILATGAATNGLYSEGSFATRVDFATLWLNAKAQVKVRNQREISPFLANPALSFLTVSNSILGSTGYRIPIYDYAGTLMADYNNLLAPAPALIALQYTFNPNTVTEYDTRERWQATTGQDSLSLTHDPRFADAGAGDFHVKSSRGRFVPAATNWVTDPPAENSPAIDAGSPSVACVEEPPNGGLVNLGRYGNTVHASLTPTNGALTIVSFNDGGQASGTNVPITWRTRGSATGTTVTISYSADGGANWIVLTNGYPAGAQVWYWDTTLYPPSMQGYLRLEGADGSLAQNDRPLSVRNVPFVFYINDNSTNNDNYCSAPGLDTNSGLATNEPMASLNALLNRYDLVGGDIVYIDTGIYRETEPWRITQSDSAGSLSAAPVVFQGATNVMPSGTVLDRQNGATAIEVDYAIGMRLRNITVSNTTSAAVLFRECLNTEAEWLAVGKAGDAFQLTGGSQLRVANSLMYNTDFGVRISGWNKNTNVVFPRLDHNVFWDLSRAAVIFGGVHGATVRHSIFAIPGGAIGYEMRDGGEEVMLDSDYNNFLLADGSQVALLGRPASNAPLPLIYGSLGTWSAERRQDLHSYNGDPLVADSAARDFHLKSSAGRVRRSGGWTNDAVTSPLVDAGDPGDSAWTNEPGENGRRVNIGLFGGSDQASQTPTNSALTLLTLNRGGVVSNQMAFNWVATGRATGHFVTVQVSIDDGANWINVQTGLLATVGDIQWSSVGVDSSPRTRWRVWDEQETNVLAVSAQPFVLHKGPIYYYVNDEFTDGDTFCNGTGISTNSGIHPDFPKRWIAEILDSYDLEAGDVIYVDTGRYQTPDPTVFGALDSGAFSQSPASQVVIQGSPTNDGSLFIISDSSGPGFLVDAAYGIRFRNLEVRGASNALAVANSYFIAGDWLKFHDCQNGIAIESSSNIVVSHSVLANNAEAGISFSSSVQGPALHVLSSILWSNRLALSTGPGFVNVSNSILGMVRPGSVGYLLTPTGPTQIESDYNNIFVGQSNAIAAGVRFGSGFTTRTTAYERVSDWQQFSDQDRNSLAHDPLLVNPGAWDFHLQSKGGRYVPGAGWQTNDVFSSVLIDSGNPREQGWTLEPDFNGRRLNIGLYGGTPEASKTPQEGRLILLSLNDGGRTSGVVKLEWQATGSASNETLCLEYSSNNAVSWTGIVCNVAANAGYFMWNSVPYGRSSLGRWRAFSLQDDSVIATNLAPFTLDNGGRIPFYVNDGSTNGDVYCTQPGSDTADGLTPATPQTSIQAILEDRILKPEDIIYVDSGSYISSTPIEISGLDSGFSNLFVTIQGSTNPLSPTVFLASSFSDPHVFFLNYAVNVKIRDLTIRNARAGLVANNSSGCVLERVRVENNREKGVVLSRCDDFRILNSVIWKNTSAQTPGIGVDLSGNSVTLDNCVVWGHPVAVNINEGGANVSNSVLDAGGINGRIYAFSTVVSPLGALRSDYNCYLRQNGALIAEKKQSVGGGFVYNDLPEWSVLTSNDWHTLTLNPFFADEVNGDFHEQSPAGRWSTGGWLVNVDTNRSSLIDAGRPGSAAWINESEPNGGTLNIGAYGGTEQASRTPTNTPWLTASSFNERGVVTTNMLLTWVYGGMSPDTPVKLEYSTDYELNWLPIATNLAVGDRQYDWPVSSIPLALALYWRVVTQEPNTNTWDVSDAPVSVVKDARTYYVNDASTNGDLWCSAVGRDWDPWNPAGTNPAAPLKSLQLVFQNLPVRSGDRVYVDTGVYSFAATNPIVIDDRYIGTADKPIQIIGSTNAAWSGTNQLWNGVLLQGDGAIDGLRLLNTRNIHLQNIRIRSAGNGIRLDNMDGFRFDGGEIFNCSTNGIEATRSVNIDVRHLRLWRNGGFGISSSGAQGNQGVVNCTFWANGAGAVRNEAGGMNVSNSILVSTSTVPIYTEEKDGGIGGDFNMFAATGGGLIATNSKFTTPYPNLRLWQTAGRDRQSIVLDPLFVDPAGGKFHLQSRAGCLSNGVWVNAANTSWAIDAGDPASTAYTNEPPTNNFRVDMGAYGGTKEASRSDASQPEILPISLRDSGMALTNEPLYWLFRGLSSTNTVNLEYSLDNGSSWGSIASLRPIGTVPLIWTTGDASPETLWRITTGSGTATETVPTNFILRTRPLVYYVNDSDRTNDVYTSAIGSATNRGYQTNSPMDSIQRVFGRYTLVGGDSILVDAGVFVLSNSIVLGPVNSGDETDRVRIIGSTNRHDIGTRFLPSVGMTNPAIDLKYARHMELAGLRLTGFSGAIRLDYADDCRLADLDVQGSSGPGISVANSEGIDLSRVLIREGLTNAVVASLSKLSLDGCVVWSNRFSAILMPQQGTVQITNSVIMASGIGAFCYASPTNPAVLANFNNLVLTNGAQLASINGVEYDRIPQWTKGSSLSWSLGSGQDQYSLSADPYFNDLAAGDFHPRSIAGRYHPVTGWTNDVPITNRPGFSPLIDMGSPQSAWSNEPADNNGARRNIGLYGNTWQASKSNTNQWLYAITASSGGVLSGGFNLTWNYGGNIPSNALVRLEYSYDNGTQNWLLIAESSVGTRQYFWQSNKEQGGLETWPTSPAGRWRLSLVTNSAVMDMTDTYFTLRNRPLRYYVNDGSRDNDVYTSATGSCANLGFYPAAPKASLICLLEDIDLEPTDEVYVDTGDYFFNTNFPIDWANSDRGAAGQPVVIYGSTHPAGSRMIVTNKFTSGYFLRVLADDVELRDMTFVGDDVEIAGERVTLSQVGITNGGLDVAGAGARILSVPVERGDVRITGSGCQVEKLWQRWGKAELLGADATILNSVFFSTNHSQTSVWVNAANLVLSNCTVVSTRGTALSKTGIGILRLGHNILVAAGGDDHAVINWQDGSLFSDWNNLLARNGTWIGVRQGKWERLAYWQAASGLDPNSVSFEPLFQSESQGDFHLNSKNGRWSPVFNDWDTDPVHSPLIDLGDPWISVGNEPWFNGYRRNLGAYGGTDQASKSLSATNFWLTALTQNDGGVLSGTNVILRWAAGNAAGKLVNLQYFTGTTWLDIVLGRAATEGSYIWDSSGFPDSMAANWRVVAADGSGIQDQTDNPFSLRNNPTNFYVNDGSPTNDIYCNALGNAANDGLSTNTPKASLQQILDAYDLEGGDVVYVDTGTYPTNADLRVIWSRGGKTNQPVVIQGNTNGPYSVLARTGNTNYPAVGLDVKASNLELRHLALQGAQRGMLLESNRNVTVYGSQFSQSVTGLVAQAATNIQVRNSAFWQTGVGVSLMSTRTSVLENLTFAQSVIAGIHLTNSVVDTLQNNIFVPEAGAYAYFIGPETSLLVNANMDYNLYDFDLAGAGAFYQGATNDLRKWQIFTGRDYRSALTNANLNNIAAGDFHPLSAHGRYDPALVQFVTNDAVTSWAIDRGNPSMPYDQEPGPNNGNRINIGMYGNTVQASKSETNVYFDARVLNSSVTITPDDPIWPLVWSANLIDRSEQVLVQFSGDGGTNWVTLTNTSAYTEYFYWTVQIQNQTVAGRWRVIGVNDPSLVDINNENFRVIWDQLRISRPFIWMGLNRFEWRGGVQGVSYRIEYSEDFGKTWNTWEEKYNGPAQINRSRFVIPAGASQLVYTFEDRTSYLRRQRWYRIVEIQ